MCQWVASTWNGIAANNESVVCRLMCLVRRQYIHVDGLLCRAIVTLKIWLCNTESYMASDQNLAIIFREISLQ